MSSVRTVRLFLVFAIGSGAAAWQPSLSAQDRVYNPYDSAQYGTAADSRDWQDVDAYVSVVDGSARLERAGDSLSDFEQVPLEVGDELRTTRGRVEVLFADGSVIALDEYTDITIDAGARWRLHGGRVKVSWRAGAFDLDASPAGVARLRSGGDYRITLVESRRGERELEVAVTRGSADLENALGRTQVRAGTRALTTAAYAPSVPYAFSAPRDNFERWTESLDADRYGVESSRYLPVELRSYGGEFDRNGYWSHHHSYGWVWYPRVAVGWQPYRSGRWTFVLNFGYSWVGGSRWAWPTHHYGRWDRGGDRWFWVPSRPTQPRRVGFAAPRSSYSAPVSYYRTQRVQQVRPVRPVQRVPQDRIQSRPTMRQPEPQAQQRSRQPEAVRPSAPSRSRLGDGTRPSAPSRSRLGNGTPSRQAPAARPSTPERSRQAPTPRASEPPRSGSRTPSAGRTSSPQSRQPSGGAVRRGGGR